MTVLDEIAAERRRQIKVEGWTPEHDDTHVKGEMGTAAACYILGDKHPMGRLLDPTFYWPWARHWWKPKDRRRNLIRAAALIVAEIERLDRAGIARAGGGNAKPVEDDDAADREREEQFVRYGLREEDIP